MNDLNTVIPSVETMYDAGVHFGHRTRRWHPKMKKYIYGIKDGIHLINLEQTYNQLNLALNLIEGWDVNLEDVLLVGTKRQAAAIVKKIAEDNGLSYITERWPGGLITNFESIKNTIQKYNEMTKLVQNEIELNKLPNKEKYNLLKERARMEKFVGGLVNLTQPPKVLIIIDPKREKTAVNEATKSNIKTIGLVDTNTNPDIVDLAIPANDDALKSIELILTTLIKAVNGTTKGSGKIKTAKNKK